MFLKILSEHPSRVAKIKIAAISLLVILFSAFSLSAQAAGPDLPVRLKIPKIKINATLESVGLTPRGAMGVPKSPAHAAWFNLGTRPGDTGSAVIAGHYGRWKNGQGSIFDNLYKLKKGDKIYIEDAKGETTTFIVREARKYNAQADASDIFFSSDGKAHLNLITCAGAYNRITRTFPNRLIVFTDKE